MLTMPKIIQGRFKILSNKKIEPDYFKMTIRAPLIAKQARPGQFVHLRCDNGTGPLLRRPISFHRIDKDNFEILYKIVGQGTILLAKRQKGGIIDVLGPLGNGFEFIRNTKYTLAGTGEIRNTIIVAGGMGVAPLLALAERLVEGRKKNNIFVLLGVKNKEHILCEKDFKKLGVKVLITTEDGSKGEKGLITDGLKFLLSTINYQLSTIYACGPKPMLKEISGISKSLRIYAQGCLEENMACGVGACLGCAIKTTKGYKRVCKDGPVFNLKELKW